MWLTSVYACEMPSNRVWCECIDSSSSGTESGTVSSSHWLFQLGTSAKYCNKITCYMQLFPMAVCAADNARLLRRCLLLASADAASRVVKLTMASNGSSILRGYPAHCHCVPQSMSCFEISQGWPSNRVSPSLLISHLFCLFVEDNWECEHSAAVLEGSSKRPPVFVQLASL